MSAPSSPAPRLPGRNSALPEDRKRSHHKIDAYTTLVTGEDTAGKYTLIDMDACTRISPGDGCGPAFGSRSTKWCGSTRIALIDPVQAWQPPMADARDAVAWRPLRQFSAQPGGQ